LPERKKGERVYLSKARKRSRRAGAGAAALFVVLALFFPVAAPGAAGEAVVPPRALLVMAFSPGDSLREPAVKDLQSAVQTLQVYGFEVDVLDVYGENGDMVEYPHHRFREMVEGERYNLLIYYGHGSRDFWALCLPKDETWAAYPDTPQGYDEAVEFGDRREHWQGGIQLAPNAMVILRHTCYSHGLGSEDMGAGAGVLDGNVVLGRINEYSYTFLHPGTGIRSYTAMANVGATSGYLDDIFRHFDQPIGTLTVPDLSSSYSAGEGYRLLAGPHYYLGSEGMFYRKNRYPGSNNSKVWSQPAWAGDPYLTARRVCGMVPGDKNGDGDNTDLGEPCFPHDPRDDFKGEDTSRNFFPFICIANPGDRSTWVRVTFYDEGGEYLTIYREVPARSRITVDCNANRHLRDRNLSIKVASVDGVPLLVERPMYFRYHGWMDGGSDVFGRRPAKYWYFAEGYTSDAHPFHEYICLGNFADRTARGKLTLFGGDGGKTVLELELPPRTRRTYYVNAYLQGDVSAVVETDVPVVAERSMYFRYRSVKGAFVADGGHTKPGLESLSESWYFAEGCVNGFFEEWLCLANPGPEDIRVEVAFHDRMGREEVKSLSLPSMTRRTLFVEEATSLRGDLSVQVDADGPIACERAMYFLYNGAWDDGHVAAGAVRPSTSWYFAEGSAFDGIHEYILVYNPGPEAAVLDAVYFLGPGEGAPTRSYVVGPGRRLTIRVNDELAAWGPPAQAALYLSSDQPVVAERAMYFDMGRNDRGGEAIRGGHVSPGVSAPAGEWFFSEAYTGY
jgi:hypothetical protein